MSRFTKEDGRLADHALVLIYRPYREAWIQPIAVYATKGVCPGDILHEILSRAIVALHLHGAIVKSVVSDGASNNRLALELFGVSGKSGLTQNNSRFRRILESLPKLSEGTPTSVDDTSTEHPMLENEKIYFFVDVPHIIKCIRNHFFLKKCVQVCNSRYFNLKISKIILMTQ